MKRNRWKEEEIGEDCCFVCKDGGELRVCDFRNCLKAYHPRCVGKDELFLEDDDRWTCSLHSCSCGKTSTFQCFCCPTSYCQSCIKSAQFIQMKKKTKGFCVNCVRLAKMIEERRTVDSDGEEVDFNNMETYEWLFRDYWAIVKDKEGLAHVDVQAADALLKRGENFQNESDSDKHFDDDLASEPDDMEDDSDESKSLFKSLRRKRGSKKPVLKKSKKERTFKGWASDELIIFLRSIGKDTRFPLTQGEVTDIVKNYVQSNNLFLPNKKRRNHVIPDGTLHTLFRKKKLKFHKISDLVKGHLAEEQSNSDDDLFFSSEENEELISPKKQKITHSDNKASKSEFNHYRKKIVGPPKSCKAALTVANIKLVYLKKSLVIELVKNPETLEEKIVGCFVRVKNDPKDFYYLVKKEFQLGQVTSIKKVQSTYKIGEMMIDVVLSVSNFSGDVKLSMLSDDDMKEEDCEDLQQLVKKGLFKQPTIAQLESKIKIVHKDITNHWINKEIAKLQRQIDRANEKGWRRELSEYLDRRVLLLTPAEQTRLLEEIPEVVPDREIDLEANMAESLTLCLVNEEPHADIAETNPGSAIGILEGNGATYIKTAGNGHMAGADVIEDVTLGEDTMIMLDDTVTVGNDTQYHSNEAVAVHQGLYQILHKKNSSAYRRLDNIYFSLGGFFTSNYLEGNGCLADANVIEDVILGSDLLGKSRTIITSTISDDQVMVTNDKIEHQYNTKPSEIPIIDLDDDDDDDGIAHIPDDQNIRSWFYMDPSGNTQGPFSLNQLKTWKESGFFEDDFKVWRTGQNEEDAVLLNTVIGLAFPI